MRIMFPDHTYGEALVIASCERLDSRRTKICVKTVRKITQGPLNEHVLQTRETAHHYNIRNSQDISSYECRTEGFRNSFFASTIAEIDINIDLLIVQLLFTYR